MSRGSIYAEKFEPVIAKVLEMIGIPSTNQVSQILSLADWFLVLDVMEGHNLRTGSTMRHHKLKTRIRLLTFIRWSANNEPSKAGVT